MMESARAMIATSANGIQKVYTYLFYVGINLKCTRVCLRAWGIFDLRDFDTLVTSGINSRGCTDKLEIYAVGICIFILYGTDCQVRLCAYACGSNSRRINV